MEIESIVVICQRLAGRELWGVVLMDTETVCSFMRFRSSGDWLYISMNGLTKLYIFKWLKQYLSYSYFIKFKKFIIKNHRK